MKNLLTLALALVTFTCSADLATNLVRVHPAPGETLPVTISKINTNLAGLDRDIEATTNSLVVASNANWLATRNATNDLNTTLRQDLAQTNVTSADVVTALGYTPLTPVQSTNAAQTVVDAELAQANTYNGSFIGNGGGLSNLPIHYVDVTHHGASPALADNSAAFQRAIAHATTFNIGAIYIPSAFNLYYTNLSPVHGTPGLTIFGDGSYFGANVSQVAFPNGSGIIFSNTYNVAVKHLKVLGGRQFTSGGLVFSNGVAPPDSFPGERVTMYDVHAVHFGHGVILHSPTEVLIEASEFSANTRSVLLLQGLIDSTTVFRSTLCGDTNGFNSGTGAKSPVVWCAPDSTCRQLRVVGCEVGDGAPYLLVEGTGNYIKWEDNNHERLWPGTNAFVIKGFTSLLVDNAAMGGFPINTNAIVGGYGSGWRGVEWRGFLLGNSINHTNGGTNYGRVLVFEDVSDDSKLFTTANVMWKSPMGYKAGPYFQDYTTTSIGFVDTNYGSRLQMYRVFGSTDRLAVDKNINNVTVREDIATIKGAEGNVIFNFAGAFSGTNSFVYNPTARKAIANGTIIDILTSEVNGTGLRIGTLGSDSGVWSDAITANVGNRPWVVQRFGANFGIGLAEPILPNARLHVGGTIQWDSTSLGNAGGLTNLNASSLASGTVPIARLPLVTNSHLVPFQAMRLVNVGGLGVDSPTPFFKGTSIFFSTNNNYLVVFEPDNPWVSNLVVRTVWQAGTVGTTPYTFQLESDRRYFVNGPGVVSMSLLTTNITIPNATSMVTNVFPLPYGTNAPKEVRLQVDASSFVSGGLQFVHMLYCFLEEAPNQ